MMLSARRSDRRFLETGRFGSDAWQSGRSRHECTGRWHFDIIRQAHQTHQLNDLPRQIKLPPFTTRRANIRKGMVIIVPALAEGQDTNPPAIGG